MRTITAPASNQLQTRYGTEPLIVVGVSFGGNFIYFGDREHANFEPRLLQVDGLDNVINISKNATVSNVTIKFLDIDGYLKEVFNRVDLHKKPIRVYQYFPDTDFAADKILLFDGYMSTPIVYNEAEMSLLVTGVSKLEDIELGFSPDNAVWRHIIPNELESPAWPMPFGTPVNYKIPQITKTAYGTLLHGFGIHDFTLQYQINALNLQITRAVELQVYLAILEGYCLFVANRMAREIEYLMGVEETPEIADLISQLTSEANHYYGLANQYHSEQVSLATRIGEMRLEVAAHQARLAQQIEFEPHTLAIWNGKTFPQGQMIWLHIGGALVYGHFHAENEDPIRDAGKVDTFYVQNVVHPKTCCFLDKHCPELGCADTNVLVPTIVYGEYYNLANEQDRATWAENRANFWRTNEIPNEPPNLMPLPPDPNASTRANNPFSVTDKLTSQFAAMTNNGRIRGDSAGFSWIPSGSRVRQAYSDPVEKVVSIVPGTMLRAAAYRTYGGERSLVTLPPSWYTLTWRDYGDGLNALIMSIPKPLSTIADAGYEDDVYVTFESDVGPNIVDVIEYITEKYLPNTACDPSTFTQARADSNYYPANFVLLERKNVISALSEIAYQACLGIWYSEGYVFLRYLPNVPASTATLTEASIDTGSLLLHYSSTEDVITKIVATYVTSYDQEQPYTIAARYNVAKYGTVEEEIAYYIYTDRDAVLHSMTFWLLRKGNTWKYINCTTALDTLELETMDPVTVNLISGFASNSAVVGCVEECIYDSTTFTINYGIWLPVRAGEMDQYKFAYYNVGEVDEYFPEPIDWVSGNGIGSPMIRDFEQGQVTRIETDSNYGLSLPRGHSREIYMPVKEQPKELPVDTLDGGGGGGYSPIVDPGWTTDEDPNISPYVYGDGAFSVEDPDAWEEEGARTRISLHGTKIWDSRTRKFATLASFFACCEHNPSIGGGAVPVLSIHDVIGVLTVGDNAAMGGFPLKYDSDTQAYAARLAYLKSDEENYVNYGKDTPAASSGIVSSTGGSYGGA